jgi:hypothetical protein
LHVSIAEAGDFMTVSVEYAPALARPINRQNELGTVARIARDVTRPKEPNVFHKPRGLFQEALSADPVKSDR